MNPSGSIANALLTSALMVAPAPGAAEPSGVTWGGRTEVASGDAHVGPWRMNESEFHYVDDPTVVIDETGIVGVAWVDQTRHDIFFQSYAPDGQARFEGPVNVSKSPETFSWLPRVSITARDTGRVYVLWQEIIFSGGSHGGEALFARSTDGGKTFEDPINLSNSLGGDGKGRLTRRYWHNGSLDLALGPAGVIYAAWTEYGGTLWFSRSTDSGDSFSEPVAIAGDGAKPARGPSLAADSEHGIYLAWTVGEDRGADIHYAKSADLGRSFSPARIVLDTNGHSEAPKIAVDDNGTIHLVYAESPAGPFDRYHVRYTRSNDRGRTFEPPREISGPAPERFESRNFPALSIDGEDNPYVLWEIFPGREDRSRGLGFTFSEDGGETFAPPSVVPGTGEPALGYNGSRQGLLMRKLAVNRSGAIAIVNSTFRRNAPSHVWLFRGHR